MCLAPKMPKPPEPPPPPPAPVISPTMTPTVVKPTMTKRGAMQQASKGTSSLTIPLSTGGSPAYTPPTTNLTIGGM